MDRIPSRASRDYFVKGSFALLKMTDLPLVRVRADIRFAGIGGIPRVDGFKLTARKEIADALPHVHLKFVASVEISLVSLHS